MKGVIFESIGAAAKVVDDLPVPEPAADQLLVKSLYTAINPMYVAVRPLLLPFPPRRDIGRRRHRGWESVSYPLSLTFFLSQPPFSIA
jgi:hypothetical protein